MYNTEISGVQIPIINTNEFLINNKIINFSKEICYDTLNKSKLVFNGGALIDEVGLGKTIQMIILSLVNKPSNITFVQPIYSKLFSRATLIIAPNQLCGQWIREFSKAVKPNYKVIIITLFSKIHYDKYTYEDLLTADFVITSNNFLNNKSFCESWCPEKNKNYLTSTSYSEHEAFNIITSLSADLYKSDIKTTLKKVNPNILLIHWNRIIVDEFHELISYGKCSYVNKLLRLFHSNFRWCITGTPFDKSTESLTNMIKFVTNSVFNPDIILQNNIYEHMLNNFFRRNTKKSIEDEYKLPPIKETLLKLQFSRTEWLLYNAFLADTSVDKFSCMIRQLCCHPKIADEMKVTLTNCKTLDDIEKNMVTHYENAMTSAKNIMLFIEYKLKSAYSKLQFKQAKRYGRFLKQLDYNVVNQYKLVVIEKPDIKVFNNFLPASDDSESDIELNPNAPEQNAPVILAQNTFIVNNDNIEEVINLIKHMHSYQTYINKITNFKKYIKLIEEKYEQAKISYQGKLGTYNYYCGVIKKLQKTEKALVEKLKSNNKDSDSDEDEELEKCALCIGVIKGNDLGVLSKCGHIYCYNCIQPYISKYGKCPICKSNVLLGDIYKIKCDLKSIMDQNTTNTSDTKSSLINKVGTKLANLIFYLKTTPKHVIIFSQWNELLKKVGEVLSDHGIKNVFCRGHIWQRDKAIRDFNNDDNIKVIMLSSESAASGTNLTKAEIVILLDPVYGSIEYRKNTEWQAIGRAYRMGQQNPVEVVRLIMENTVEEDIYNLNQKTDNNMNIESKTINMDDSIIKEIVESSSKIPKKVVKKVVKKVGKKVAKKAEDDDSEELI